MTGTMIADDKGYVIETLYTMFNEPKMIVSRYRVTIMDGRPESAREQVRYSNLIWEGRGFRAGTDNTLPESGEIIELKAPRGKKVWRDGEWHKR